MFSGTTVAVVVVVDRSLFVADVGDSSVVLCRRRRALVPFVVFFLFFFFWNNVFYQLLLFKVVVAQALCIVAARTEARSRSRRVVSYILHVEIICDMVFLYQIDHDDDGRNAIVGHAGRNAQHRRCPTSSLAISVFRFSCFALFIPSRSLAIRIVDAAYASHDDRRR